MGTRWATSGLAMLWAEAPCRHIRQEEMSYLAKKVLQGVIGRI